MSRLGQRRCRTKATPASKPPPPKRPNLPGTFAPLCTNCRAERDNLYRVADFDRSVTLRVGLTTICQTEVSVRQPPLLRSDSLKPTHLAVSLRLIHDFANLPYWADQFPSVELLGPTPTPTIAPKPNGRGATPLTRHRPLILRSVSRPLMTKTRPFAF